MPGALPAAASSRRALRRGEPVRVRIAAPIGDDWEPLLAEVYAAGNVTIYIDEVYGVCHRGQAGPWLTALYTRGRELGIGVWAATQRPSWIPLFVLSESEWLLTFRLQLEADQRRVAQMMGEDAYAELRGHSFLLYNSEWERPVYRRSIKG
jgi:hypothetical protein